MALFSIVVPIYNVEEYLSKCVESVLNQTFSDFELILVDDGSPDNCPGICDEYAKKDERVKVLHKKNGGLVSARKAGAVAAIGEYVVCVDGDDWIDIHYLEKFEKVIKKSSPDIVCCGYIKAFENEGKNEEVKVPEEIGLYDIKKIKNIIFPKLIEDGHSHYFPCTIWAKAYKRKMYVKAQLLVNNQIKIGEDHACTKVCIHDAESVYVIEDCLYYYRQNLSSMTKNRKAFAWNDPQRLGEHFEKELPMDEYDFQDQVNRFVVHLLFNTCVTQFNRKEKYSAIKKDIEKNISKPYYKKAIENCIYDKRNIKGSIVKKSFDHRWFLLMKLYNTLHEF